jgi:O-antigen ligase
MVAQTPVASWPGSASGALSGEPIVLPLSAAQPTKLEWYFTALALVVFCCVPFIVGDQPQGAESLNPVDMLHSVSPAGDMAKQLILLALYSGFAALFLHKVPRRAMLLVGTPLLLLIGWTMASAIWSVNADVTLRRTVALVGTVIVGVYLGSRFSPRQLLHLLALVAFIVLSLSLFLALFAPSLGLDFEGRLRGVTAHKNALGSFAAVAFLVAAGQLRLDGVSRLMSAVPRLVLPLSVICMAWAHSTAVLPVITAALGALIVGRILRRSSAGLLALLPLVACVVVFVLTLVATHSGDLAEMMGKDADISGRTLVWSFVERMILARPLLGYGFAAFWVGDNSPGAVFWSNTHLGVPHAHNGYLQLMLDLGAIGLILFLLAALITVIRLAWLMRHNRQELSVWPLGFVAFFLVANVSETWLWLGNELLPLLFVYVVVRANADFLKAALAIRIESLRSAAARYSSTFHT